MSNLFIKLLPIIIIFAHAWIIAISRRVHDRNTENKSAGWTWIYTRNKRKPCLIEIWTFRQFICETPEKINCLHHLWDWKEREKFVFLHFWKKKIRGACGTAEEPNLQAQSLSRWFIQINMHIVLCSLCALLDITCYVTGERFTC